MNYEQHQNYARRCQVAVRVALHPLQEPPKREDNAKMVNRVRAAWEYARNTGLSPSQYPLPTSKDAVARMVVRISDDFYFNTALTPQDIQLLLAAVDWYYQRNNWTTPDEEAATFNPDVSGNRPRIPPPPPLREVEAELEPVLGTDPDPVVSDDWRQRYLEPSVQENEAPLLPERPETPELPQPDPFLMNDDLYEVLGWEEEEDTGRPKTRKKKPKKTSFVT